MPPRRLDLRLLVSSERARQVRFDHTVLFAGRRLQLKRDPLLPHLMYCRFTVHGFADAILGVTFQDQLLGTHSGDGEWLPDSGAGDEAA